MTVLACSAVKSNVAFHKITKKKNFHRGWALYVVR